MIHLKNSSTCHRQRYRSAPVSAGIAKLLARKLKVFPVAASRYLTRRSDSSGSEEQDRQASVRVPRNWRSLFILTNTPRHRYECSYTKRRMHVNGWMRVYNPRPLFPVRDSANLPETPAPQGRYAKMGASRNDTREVKLPTRKIRPPKVDMNFTDLNLTAYGGSSILAPTGPASRAVRTARRGSPGQGPQPRRDRRGDAVGDDRLPGPGRRCAVRPRRVAGDAVARTLLEQRDVPEARRAGEWLARLRKHDVKGSRTRHRGSRSGWRR